MYVVEGESERSVWGLEARRLQVGKNDGAALSPQAFSYAMLTHDFARCASRCDMHGIFATLTVVQKPMKMPRATYNRTSHIFWIVTDR